MMLHVRKEHFDFLSLIKTFLPVSVSLNDLACAISSCFVNATSDFAVRRVWAAAGLQWTVFAIRLMAAINKGVGFRDPRSWHRVVTIVAL